MKGTSFIEGGEAKKKGSTIDGCKLKNDAGAVNPASHLPVNDRQRPGTEVCVPERLSPWC